MKRALFLLFPAVLLILIALVGCDDETNPKFTRIRVYPECGVAPLNVDGLAIVSGGDESGDPTGGNNNLEMTWNFGDGEAGGGTSIAYHTYDVPGEYQVIATATDPDGKTTSLSQMVRVMPDTLEMRALSDFDDFPTSVTVCDSVHFDVWASSCEIDPLVDDDYRNLIFEWHMNDGTDTVFRERQPVYSFPQPGDYEVTLSVSYAALATTRRDTLRFTVELADILTAVPTLVAQPEFTIGTTNLVEWSDESANGALRYVVERSVNADFSTVAFGATTFLEHEFTGLVDAQVYYYRVRVHGCPNYVVWSETESSMQDDLPPVSSARSLAVAQNNFSFDVPVRTTDTAVGVASVELFFQVDGGGYSSFGVIADPPTNTAFQFTATSDGVYDFYTVGTDHFDHVETAPSNPDDSSIVVTLPQFSSAGPLDPTQDSLVFDVPYSADYGVEFVELFFQVDGGGYTSFGDDFTSSPITFTAPDGGDGTYDFYTVSTDYFDNVEPAPGSPDASTVVVDLPPVSSAGPLGPYQDSLTFNVPFSVTDPTKSVESVELFFRVDGGGYSSFGVFTDSPISFTAAGEGVYDFYTLGTDDQGNVEIAPGTPDDSTIVDITRPASSAGPLDPTQDSLVFDVPFSATDSNGVASVELFFQVGGGEYSRFGEFTASPISFTAEDGDGTYNFYTLARDNAGNRETVPSVPDASTVVVEVP